MRKIKMLKEYKGIGIGEIIESSKKSAENFVSQGYAEYVEEPRAPKIPKPQDEQVNSTEESQTFDITYSYSCQNCQRSFESKKELELIPKLLPLCSQKCRLKLFLRYLEEHDKKTIVNLYMGACYSKNTPLCDKKNILKFCRDNASLYIPTIKPILNNNTLLTRVTKITQNVLVFNTTHPLSIERGVLKTRVKLLEVKK